MFAGPTDVHLQGPGVGGGYKPRITELRYFYILVRSKGYELDGVRRTIDSKLNRYPYPSFILIQLGSNDLGITKTLDLINNIECDLIHLTVLLPSVKII